MRLTLLACIACTLCPIRSADARKRRPWPRFSRAKDAHRRHVPRGTLGSGEVRAGRFLSTRGMPAGPRRRARPGDYFLRTRRLLAVIRAEDGSLTDLALAPGFVDSIGWGKTRVCDTRGAHTVALRGIAILGARRRPALQARGTAAGGSPLELTTTYRVDRRSGQLEIDTLVKNVGRRTRYQLRVCDHLGLSNTRLQLPGLGEIRRPRRGRRRARFCARREGEISYALVPRRGRLALALGMSAPLGAFDPSIDAHYETRVNLAPGRSMRVRRLLVVERGTIASAVATALSWAGVPLRQVELVVDKPSPDSRLVVLDAPPGGGQRCSAGQGGCKATRRPFLITRALPRQRLRLPRGRALSVLLEVPGVGRSPARALGKSASLRLAPPPSGRLLFTVAASTGAPAPAKLILSRLDAPLASLGWEGRLRSDGVVYTAGRGELELAPGRYRIVASRGFEHRLFRSAPLVVRAGKKTSARLTPRRAFRTPGWVACDLHTHGRASFDSPLSARDRLIAAAASGTEMIVAADHNAVTDYRTRAAFRSLAKRLIVVPGQEMTSQGHLFGHFNAFPLPPGKPVPWYVTTPARMFAAARTAGAALIQVNHPRMGSIGYFDQLAVDPRSGQAAPLYDAGFDLLEVFNGDHLDDPSAVERNLRDWYALLDRGRRVTATGGSDSHRLPTQDVGYPRTYVLWNAKAGKAEASDLSRIRPQRIFEALKRQRAVVSTGPFIDLTADGQPVGSQVKAKKGKVLLKVEVKAAPWVDVSSVELVGGGRTIRRFRVRGRAIRRFRREIVLKPPRDGWYIAIARGRRPDPTQARANVRPFALTNPIWIDADGDGRVGPRR